MLKSALALRLHLLRIKHRAMDKPIPVVCRCRRSGAGEGAARSAQHKPGGRELLGGGAPQHTIDIEPGLGANELVRHYDVMPVTIVAGNSGRDHLAARGDIDQVPGWDFHRRMHRRVGQSDRGNRACGPRTHTEGNRKGMDQ